MVKLVQLLCPQRHAIFATAYEEGVSNFLGACEMIETMVGPNGPYKRQCMICGSRDLRFEEGTTPWKTLIEAAPHLAKTQADIIRSRLQLDAEGKTLEKML
jgi:hypothetical protein